MIIYVASCDTTRSAAHGTKRERYYQEFHNYHYYPVTNCVLCTLLVKMWVWYIHVLTQRNFKASDSISLAATKIKIIFSRFYCVATCDNAARNRIYFIFCSAADDLPSFSGHRTGSTPRYVRYIYTQIHRSGIFTVNHSRK